MLVAAGWELMAKVLRGGLSYQETLVAERKEEKTLLFTLT